MVELKQKDLLEIAARPMWAVYFPELFKFCQEPLCGCQRERFVSDLDGNWIGGIRPAYNEC